MLAMTLELGTSVASGDQQSSTDVPPTIAFTTLGSLLEALSKDPPQILPMLKATAVLLTRYFNKQPSEILLDSVREELDGFRRFIEENRYKKNSVRTYLNHARILLRSASKLGWKPGRFVPEMWQHVYEISKSRGLSRLVMHLARLRSSPKDVTIADVDRWVQRKTQEGRWYVHQRILASRFWQLLLECDCTELDLSSVLRHPDYGMPLQEFPAPLRAEVEELLRWKQAAVAFDRPKGARIRAVTARSLQQLISRLAGYAFEILGCNQITSMQELVTRDVIGGFVEWSMNVRGVKGRTLMQSLSRLHAALNQHPRFSSFVLDWFKTLLDAIPLESASAPRKRKAEKFLEYEVIASIPAKIRSSRSTAAKRGSHAVAMTAMYEFLIRWMLILPWRQRNLRECRIGGVNPNLWKGRAPIFSDIEKPGWVRQQEQANPNSEFWLIRFSAEETKTGNEPQMFLPRQLIEPLEEYLEKFRPCLVRGEDPGTLFMNGAGKSLGTMEMTRLVSQLTLQYGGRRVNPHLFRDVIAYTWLKEHPKDFLTVSKMLWHSNITTTIKVYGAKFNESSAVCAMESWLDEREAVARTDNRVEASC